MAKKSSCTNNNLHNAKRKKNDEFFTKLSDVEDELRHYKHHFNGKVVLCNCDDPEYSHFWKYFHLNFVKIVMEIKICILLTIQNGNIHIC